MARLRCAGEGNGIDGRGATDIGPRLQIQDDAIPVPG
jgi:hypothetical protein